MTAMKTAVGIGHLEGPLKQRLQKVCQLAVDGISFDFRYELKASELSQTAIRELRKRLSEFGMVPGPAFFPLRHGLLEASGMDARIEALKKAIELAGQLGTRQFRIDVGLEELNDQTISNQQLLGILNDLAAHGDRYGIVLCGCFPLDDLNVLKELCRQVSRGHFLLDVDPLLILSADQNVAAVLRQMHAYLGHIIAHDGTVDSRGRIKETALGRGEVNFDELIVTLDEIGYQQWITLVRESGSQPEVDLQNAVNYIKAIRMEL